jgi:hypothetical protein
MMLCLGVYVNEQSDLFRAGCRMLAEGSEMVVGQDSAPEFHRRFFVYAVLGRSPTGSTVYLRMSLPFGTRFEAEAQLVKMMDTVRTGEGEASYGR